MLACVCVVIAHARTDTNFFNVFKSNFLVTFIKSFYFYFLNVKTFIIWFGNVVYYKVTFFVCKYLYEKNEKI